MTHLNNLLPGWTIDITKVGEPKTIYVNFVY